MELASVGQNFPSRSLRVTICLSNPRTTALAMSHILILSYFQEQDARLPMYHTVFGRFNEVFKCHSFEFVFDIFSALHLEPLLK